MVEFGRQSENDSNRSGPDMTSLMDVVFILLIFFVVSTVFTTKGMEIELPVAETSKPVSGRSLEIELDGEGRLFCDTEPVTFAALAHRLNLTAELPPARQPEHILLKAAPQARVAQFVRVVDLVRSGGFSNLVIVTRTDADDGAGEERLKS